MPWSTGRTVLETFEKNVADEKSILAKNTVITTYGNVHSVTTEAG